MTGNGRTKDSVHRRSVAARLVVVVAVLLVLSACAAGANPSAASGAEAGFWLGLWQGIIAPIMFVVSLFNHSVGIYEVHNVGAWYDFGFVLGMSIFFNGTHVGVRTGSRTAKRPVHSER
jgi:hypothetical protein